MIAFLLLFAALGRLYRDMIKRPESRALLIMTLVLITAGVVFYTRVEKWSVLNAIYFCVVTLATVGYGDITPTTDAGKIFTVFYIVLGLGIISGFFATIGNLIEPGRLLRRGEREVRHGLPFVNRRDEPGGQGSEAPAPEEPNE